MKLFDVSLPIGESTIVYPGNSPPSLRFIRRIPDGNSNLSELILGSHTGTHADAPLHGRNGKKSVDSLPLNSLVGRCRVLDLTKAGPAIGKAQLEKFAPKRGEIIVLKTENSRKGFTRFRPDFAHLTLEGAKYLSRRKIRTIATDYLGIQKFRSGNMLVHNELLDKGVVIFEGLYLSGVAAGSYLFIGLPLKVTGAEAAPARVLLGK